LNVAEDGVVASTAMAQGEKGEGGVVETGVSLSQPHVVRNERGFKERTTGRGWKEVAGKHTGLDPRSKNRGSARKKIGTHNP